MQRGSLVASLLALVSLNGYICRELFFTHHLAYMNSMHGFWMALARLAGDRWWSGGWWPYWNAGMPFEYSYSPLVPAFASLIAWSAGAEIPATVHALMGIVYCMAPVTLFVMAWRITGQAGPSLLAALAYSLLSPASVLLPDAEWRLGGIREARQLYLMAVWDELPHLTALALLPLAVLLVVRGSRTSLWRGVPPAALVVVLMMLASPFGLTTLLLAMLCLLSAADSPRRKDLFLTGAIAGVLAYLIVSPYLPPSLLFIIRDAHALHGQGLHRESWYAVGVLLTGGVILHLGLRRLTRDWWLRFLALFAWATLMIPGLHAWLDWRVLPQPGRYKVEMELAWALLAAFLLWRLGLRLPGKIRVAVVLVAVICGGLQVSHHLRFSALILNERPPISETIEYKTAAWLEDYLPGQRVYLPGSIAQWLNAFTNVPQLSGGSWSTAAHRSQQVALYAILTGENLGDRDAEISLLWLKAFGVQAVAVSGHESSEFWKPYRHPEKFEGVLPVLWRQGGVALYRVPHRSNSLARVVPKDRIVHRQPAHGGAVDELERYVRALEDTALEQAQMEWHGSNGATIRAALRDSEVLSVQVAHHAGWKARSAGASVPVHRDGLGLIWLQPRCGGPCEIELWYDGGAELKLLRSASALSLAAVMIGWLFALRQAGDQVHDRRRRIFFRS